MLRNFKRIWGYLEELIAEKDVLLNLGYGGLSRVTNQPTPKILSIPFVKAWGTDIPIPCNQQRLYPWDTLMSNSP